ncbi:MAG TPA: hypothetical protein VGS62_03510 [Streptosporangiaceae bacterium]|nr:hypothetical protein [Streptosporangiaceae bacterium]
MRLLKKREPALTAEEILTDALSRGGSERDIRAALGLTAYKLYRDETACDTDDFGPPYGEYPTLALAMVAAHLPVSAWHTSEFCPDEIFSTRLGGEVDWQIIAPGAAAEFTALKAA